MKCVFIDPPYNTGSAFTHYDDGVEHSIWLSLMRDRLEIIRRLLSEDGSLWITIDDNEAHYLKVLCDEVFGRANFVANVIWQKRTHTGSNRVEFVSCRMTMFWYTQKQLESIATEISSCRAEEADGRYSNPDNDPRGPWASSDAQLAAQRHAAIRLVYPQFERHRRSRISTTGTAAGAIHERIRETEAESRIYSGHGGRRLPSRIKMYLSEVQGASCRRHCGPTEASSDTTKNAKT